MKGLMYKDDQRALHFYIKINSLSFAFKLNKILTLTIDF
ncbi:MAG: hypothetical protein JWP44_1393 [Mucilaginibacter sp.]|nr:hypothetical protein [Mucilaginibacter sp.]